MFWNRPQRLMFTALLIIWLPAPGRSVKVVTPPAAPTAAPAPASPLVPVVCIDPGHPSEVGRGTHGKHITEIAVAWKVALKLKDILEDTGFHVVLTKRSQEQFVRNHDRANVANTAHANLMVRLHCDADAGTGIATYAPDRTGLNRGVRGPSQDVIEQSQIAAGPFHAAMIKYLAGRLKDRGLKSDIATQVGAQQGALTGSIYSRVPVLLVEMCVLTNPRDEALVASDIGQKEMARALASGVVAALTALHRAGH
jgi:N-acetylmuramoyl-L-alanine amidase